MHFFALHQLQRPCPLLTGMHGPDFLLMNNDAPEKTADTASKGPIFTLRRVYKKANYLTIRCVLNLLISENRVK